MPDTIAKSVPNLSTCWGGRAPAVDGARLERGGGGTPAGWGAGGWWSWWWFSSTNLRE